MMISHEKSFARKGVHDEIASNVSHEKYHCLVYKFSPVLSYETYQAIWSWTPFRPKLFSDEILTFVAYDMIVSYDTCCVKTFYHQLLTCSCLNYFKISIRALFVVPQNYKKTVCFFFMRNFTGDFIMNTFQAISVVQNSSWTDLKGPNCTHRYRFSRPAKTGSVGLSQRSWIFRKLLTTYSSGDIQ